MRIATWNINSVRLRIDLVTQFIDQQKPDVLCLQETKTMDEFFPVDALVAKGFKYYHFTGMKSYNGVCVFSKHQVDNPKIYKRVGKNDCRHISVTIKGKGHDFELHNIYIPAGGYEADIREEKFKHKLDFVDELAAWFKKERSAKDKMVAVGDFNIAPLENDVWDHKKMLSVVSHTPIECEKFARFYDSVGFVDGVRHFVPEDKKLYSWWSYRAANWDAADRGRRLDHVWVTKGLESALKGYQIPRDIRGWEKPSDHVPVIVDLKS